MRVFAYAIHCIPLKCASHMAQQLPLHFPCTYKLLFAGTENSQLHALCKQNMFKTISHSMHCTAPSAQPVSCIACSKEMGQDAVMSYRKHCTGPSAQLELSSCAKIKSKCYAFAF